MYASTFAQVTIFSNLYSDLGASYQKRCMFYNGSLANLDDIIVTLYIKNTHIQYGVFTYDFIVLSLDSVTISARS